MAQMAGSMIGAGGGMAGGIASFIASRKEAKRLREAGVVAAAERRREGGKLLGAQRAAFAAAGVELEGTPLDVLAETAESEELDALRAKFEFDLAARTVELKGIQAIFSGFALGGGAAAGAGINAGSSLTGNQRNSGRPGPLRPQGFPDRSQQSTSIFRFGEQPATRLTHGSFLVG